MIDVSDVSFSYDGVNELNFPAFSCSKGGKLLLLGDSGTGKTTLLHLMCGLLRPTKGSITVSGKNLGGMNDRELDNFRGQELGIVFQQSHFVQSLTVEENLALPYLLSKKPINSKDLKKRTLELLERLGVGHKSKSRPKDLSVGEQQRASIARALVHYPSVVFADEPSSALDDTSTDSVIKLLEEETAKAGATLIIVTHDSRLKARYNDRVELTSTSSSLNHV